MCQVQVSRGKGIFIFDSPLGFVSIDRSDPGPKFGRHRRVVKKGILPETKHEHVRLVPRGEGCEEVLVTTGADLNSVWYNEGGLLLGHSRDLLPGDGHRRLPAEDVGVEAQVVGGDVDTPMDQDVLLQGAGVVAYQHLVVREPWKVLLDLVTPLPVVGGHRRGHPGLLLLSLYAGVGGEGAGGGEVGVLAARPGTRRGGLGAGLCRGEHARVGAGVH